jgi:pseudouridine kinase
MKGSVLCIGAANVDRTFALESEGVFGTSNPAAAPIVTFGGVARNVAENASRLGAAVSLISCVGYDEMGDALIEEGISVGIDMQAVDRDERFKTAEYVAALNPDGGLSFAMSSADVLSALTSESLEARVNMAALDATWWFAECNLSAAALARVVELARDRSAHVVVDTVSVAKSRRLPERLDGVELIFCNLDEAAAYLGVQCAGDRAAELLVKRGARGAVVTMGARGAYAASDRIAFVPALAARARSATGAGDAFVAATMLRVAMGDALCVAVPYGAAAAALTVESENSVSPALSWRLLEARRSKERSA